MRYYESPEWKAASAANKTQTTLETIKNRIDIRLNNRLCDMKPNYDDSITGFNEAWDIVREFFKEELCKIKQ